MTRAQLDAFLDSSLRVAPGYYPLLLLLARTGLRVGEALALKWSDVDVAGQEIRVERALSAGHIENPKAGHGRTVDMSQQLGRTLTRLHLERKSETLKRGWRELPPWVFCNQVGKLLDANRVRKVFQRTLKAGGLPLHFHPHCLRHTFASLLLQQQESPAYVQRQLGHASIKLTVDTYGKWLPIGNKAAVDRLDKPLSAAASGSKVVAAPRKTLEDESEAPEKVGSPGWSRTSDFLINSQALYQLSYRGVSDATGSL